MRYNLAMPEARIEYQVLEHTADTGFLVSAPSWERLYINAALSMTDIMVKLQHIHTVEKRVIKVSAETKESLMIQWLNEVLYLFGKEKFLARRIVFNRFDGKQIEAQMNGEFYNPVRHGAFSEIKAAMFDQLQLGECALPEPHFEARVFLSH